MKLQLRTVLRLQVDGLVDYIASTYSVDLKATLPYDTQGPRKHTHRPLVSRLHGLLEEPSLLPVNDNTMGLPRG